jgi:hypothetical protein
MTHKFFEPDSLPAQALAKGDACTHRTRNPLGECIDQIGCADGVIPLVCPCGSCNSADITRRETANPYARQIMIIKPPTVRAGTVERCRKIACHNAGNGRECWTLRTYDGQRAYELPSREIAEMLAENGGRIAATHGFSFC